MLNTCKNQAANGENMVTMNTTLGNVIKSFTHLLRTQKKFGRTAKENGTKSPKVITDWQALDKKELFEQRDLRQTTDVRGFYGDVIHHAFNISKQKIKESVFPGTQQKLNLDIWG